MACLESHSSYSGAISLRCNHAMGEHNAKNSGFFQLEPSHRNFQSFSVHGNPIPRADYHVRKTYFTYSCSTDRYFCTARSGGDTVPLMLNWCWASKPPKPRGSTATHSRRLKPPLHHPSCAQDPWDTSTVTGTDTHRFSLSMLWAGGAAQVQRVWLRNHVAAIG